MNEIKELSVFVAILYYINANKSIFSRERVTRFIFFFIEIRIKE